MEKHGSEVPLKDRIHKARGSTPSAECQNHQLPLEREGNLFCWHFVDCGAGLPPAFWALWLIEVWTELGLWVCLSAVCPDACSSIWEVVWFPHPHGYHEAEGAAYWAEHSLALAWQNWGALAASCNKRAWDCNSLLDQSRPNFIQLSCSSGLPRLIPLGLTQYCLPAHLATAWILDDLENVRRQKICIRACRSTLCLWTSVAYLGQWVLFPTLILLLRKSNS